MTGATRKVIRDIHAKRHRGLTIIAAVLGSVVAMAGPCARAAEIWMYAAPHVETPAPGWEAVRTDSGEMCGPMRHEPGPLDPSGLFSSPPPILNGRKIAICNRRLQNSSAATLRSPSATVFSSSPIVASPTPRLMWLRERWSGCSTRFAAMEATSNT